MNRLRVFIYALVFYISSIFLLALFWSLVSLWHDLAIWEVKTWMRWQRFCARYILRIESHVAGAALPPAPAILAIKHESHYETFECLLLFDAPSAVMKKELNKIPFCDRIGRHYGMIPVDREAGSAALKSLLQQAKIQAAKNRYIAIYPEGTRIEHGKTVPLESGLTALYKSLNLPIVPIAMNAGKLWPKTLWQIKPGTVEWLIGEAIPPGLPRAEMEARVFAGINALNSLS
jgi:1-acyl-sn-glycerol-3-phosphate acyltransferase